MSDSEEEQELENDISLPLPDEDEDDNSGSEDELLGAAMDEPIDGNLLKVELGFAEECNPLLLRSPSFPSKIGGPPAWLDPEHLPLTDNLKCANCRQPLLFLLQAYTGGIWTSDETYHRTIFVFCCRNAVCYSGYDNGSFCVLRSQLPRVNKYYGPDVLDDDVLQSMEYESKVPLCAVCGMAAISRCARCLQTHYCNAYHQIWHWKNGHSKVCKEGVAISNEEARFLDGKFLFSESELVTEIEPEKSPLKSDDERMLEYREYAKKLASRTATDDGDDKMTSMSKVDAVFLSFRERTARDPDQVFRYQRNGQPLWIGKRKPLPSDIPACSHCSGPRQFECQINPQVLNHLGVDVKADGASIDWGVLAIYTCANSCSLPPDTGYAEEFLWQNPVS